MYDNMDAKGRTFAFKGTKNPSVWMVLVFEQGIKGVARTHKINIVGDIRAHYQPYCNCHKRFYSKEKTCHHETEFMIYMQKLIDKGLTEKA